MKKRTRFWRKGIVEMRVLKLLGKVWEGDARRGNEECWDLVAMSGRYRESVLLCTVTTAI